MNSIGSIWSQHNSTVVNRLDYLGTQQRVCRGLNTILGIPDSIDADRLAQIGKELSFCQGSATAHTQVFLHRMPWPKAKCEKPYSQPCFSVAFRQKTSGSDKRI